jgi:hypothetical protein
MDETTEAREVVLFALDHRSGKEEEIGFLL